MAPRRAHRPVGAPSRHAGPGEEHGAHTGLHRPSRASTSPLAGSRPRTPSSPQPRRAGWDAKSQLMAMDDEGLDVAVLFPSRGLFVLGLDSVDVVGPDGLEPELRRRDRTGLQRLAGTTSAPRIPTRLFGAGLLAPHDVGARRRRDRPLRRRPRLQDGVRAPRPGEAPAVAPSRRTTRSGRSASDAGSPICFHGGGQNELRPDYSLEASTR